MTVVSIRTHKRYAVRRPVCLKAAEGESAEGLMIEASATGCRISSLEQTAFAPGDAVIVHIDDLKLPGSIRWARDGLAGIKFEIPFFANGLRDLIARARDTDGVLQHGG